MKQRKYKKTKYDEIISDYINIPSKREICNQLNIDAGNISRGSVSEENKKKVIHMMIYSANDFINKSINKLLENEEK